MLTNCRKLLRQTWTKLHTWSRELNLWLLIISVNYAWPLPQATSTILCVTCIVCDWVACPCLSRSAVAMHALTWFVFALSFFHTNTVFWQYSFTSVLGTRLSGWVSKGRSLGLCEIFKCAHLKLTVYGRKQTSKQANKQASTYTHGAQCSHASVGLTQACPN